MNALTEVFIATLNSLWQATLLAGLVWLALRFAPRMNAATRYAIWWAALAVVLILPAAPATIRAVRSWLEPKPIAVVERSRPVLPSPVAIPETAPLIVVQETGRATWPVWIAAIWGLVLIYRSSQILRSYFFLRGLKRRAAVSHEALPATGRAAQLLLSEEIESPIAVGFAQPAVVLPAALPAEISALEMEHVLLHESAHLARRDDWTNLAARVLGGVLALHPVALWILRRIEIEREAACDDWVVARTQSARPYAESLARLYEWRLARRNSRQAGEVLASGIFGSGSRLGERIEALLGNRNTVSAGCSARRALLSVALLIGLAGAASFVPSWIVLGQDVPTFEAVSIKVHRGGGGSGRVENGTITYLNYTLGELLQLSLGVSPRQIAAPDWITDSHSSERYDFVAKAATPMPADRLWAMALPVLVERFHLKIHRETKDLPVFALTVAPGGPKFKPGDGGETVIERAAGGVSYSNVTMGRLATILTAMLQSRERLVVDRTRLEGKYTFAANLPGTSTNSGGAAAKVAEREALDAMDSPVVGNLREQLGLRLEATRAPVEILVVDHAEKVPEEN